MSRLEYWKESLASASEECGLVMTADQTTAMAESAIITAEMYGEYSGNDVATSNLLAANRRELAAAKAETQRERDKVHCKECDGRGRITIAGPYHSSTSACFKCHGDGRHDP